MGVVARFATANTAATRRDRPSGNGLLPGALLCFPHNLHVFGFFPPPEVPDERVLAASSVFFVGDCVCDNYICDVSSSPSSNARFIQNPSSDSDPLGVSVGVRIPLGADTCKTNTACITTKPTCNPSNIRPDGHPRELALMTGHFW